MAPEKLTPMMRQYKSLKEKHPDCLLFFRLGDFYEMFFEDAVEASRLLNLTLTKRQTAPMCGIPHHAIESYLGRLTKAGKKVAICEQLSDPSLPGIVTRDVIRVVTPGTTFDPRIIDQKTNHFIISVAFQNEKIGLAACDLTTGLFQVASFNNLDELKEEIFRLSPAECIVDAGEKALPDFLKKFEKLPVFPHQCWDEPRELLAKQFGVKDMKGFGIDDLPSVIFAAALLISYLKETQKSDLEHIRSPKLLTRTDEMILDETAIRNLELIYSLKENKREGSLLSVIDMTLTPMGGRTLRDWLLHPLCNKDEIEKRLDSVGEIAKDFSLKTKLAEIIKEVLDMERLLSKLAIGSGSARDILGIAISCGAIIPTTELLNKTKSELLKGLYGKLKELNELDILRKEILDSIVENPPLSVKDGGLIKDGINAELDELRALSKEGKGFVQELQKREIERTAIQSLKVRFNQVFGYYIEITKSNLDRVPEDYIRKQTLVNCERYITPELKEYEEKILGAEEKMKALEYEIFLRVREDVKAKTRQIQTAAQIFGVLDALLSFALVAERNRYCRPQIFSSGEPLVIKNGRHPVVENLAEGKFVPNDVTLTPSKIILVTGPNMGGKSTFLRQTALVALLAHIGSFVPADEANIPLIDRIFTRVGATDNLVKGQSTFMVEMQETAQILHYATKNSLIILDEVGRGTSTYDGVSLAWAILEHIHDNISAKTLFATHYHELISVAEKLPNAANFSVAVKEEKGGVVFLYRVLPGAIDRSYGIEVARLAGLPKEVVSKAKIILSDLEEGAPHHFTNKVVGGQLSIFEERKHKVIEELKSVDLDGMTPLDALKKLDEWKKMA